MSDFFVSALNDILEKRPAFTISDALNAQQCAAAVLPHSRNCWELEGLADGTVRLNPPKTPHDCAEDALFSLEISFLKMNCKDNVSGISVSRHVPDELLPLYLAPGLTASVSPAMTGTEGERAGRI